MLLPRYPICFLLVFVSVSLTCGAETSATDPKLVEAYRRCYFSHQYPPEVVREMQGKLKNVPHAADALKTMAKDSRREVRVLVAVLLGELAEGDGVSTLWGLLQDEVEAVRLAASSGLVRLRQTISVPVETSALKDQRPEVRRLAVATLGKLYDESLNPTLVECMGDENEMVRMEAIRVLQYKPNNKDIEDALLKRMQDTSIEVRTKAASTLCAYTGVGEDAKNSEPNQKVLDALEAALKDPDWHVRAAALMSLGWHGKHQTSAQVGLTKRIIETLRKDDFALVRDRAADSLASGKKELVVDPLVEAVVSDDHAGRYHAARAICTGRHVEALPSLLKHCSHSDAEVRERIMEIFGTLGGTNELAAICRATEDSNANVQLAAIEALQKIGERTGDVLLVKKLEDPNPHIRAAVARALGQTGNKNIVPKLLPLLRDPNGFVRSAAAEALGKLGDRSAVPALVGILAGVSSNEVKEGLILDDQQSFRNALLKQTETEQKTSAALALGELRDPAAVDPLVQYGLKSQDLGLRAVAAYSLGQIGDVRAIEPLQTLVNPYYAALRVNTDGSPAIIPPETAITALLRETREKESRVRASVVWALGQIADPVAHPTLIKALNDENSLVRDNAAEALAKLQERQELERRRAENNQKPPVQ
jgi:HEAT repeat protein